MLIGGHEQQGQYHVSVQVEFTDLVFLSGFWRKRPLIVSITQSSNDALGA